MNAGTYDPTARTALHRSEEDPLGLALALLTPVDAQFVVARMAYEVSLTKLVQVFKARVPRHMHDYDFPGHLKRILEDSCDRMRLFLTESGFIEDGADLDWANSPAVQRIAGQLGLGKLYPCKNCQQEKLPLLSPNGRPARYCSNACRQAAYRRRLATPALDPIIDRENGLAPCFAGMEGKIPIEARVELMDLIEAQVVTVGRLELNDGEVSDPVITETIDRRWKPHSPLRRAAHAALTLLESEKVDLRSTRLHGNDLHHSKTPYYVSMECRYLPAALRCFEEHDGIEWIEIPRPSRRGKLLALRIKLADWQQLALRTVDDSTYFG